MARGEIELHLRVCLGYKICDQRASKELNINQCGRDGRVGVAPGVGGQASY